MKLKSLMAITAFCLGFAANVNAQVASTAAPAAPAVAPQRVIAGVWIPVADLARARAFYSVVLQTELVVDTSIGVPLVFLNSNNPFEAILVADIPGLVPNSEGARAVFEASGQMDAFLQRVIDAGGYVILQPTEFGDAAAGTSFWYAEFEDTEGNVLGLFGAVR